MKTLTTQQIIGIIDQTICLFLDRDSTYRRKAEELLPVITGYAPEIIRLGLTTFLKTFRRPQLKRFLAEDLGNYMLLDEFQPRPKGGYSKAVGPDVIVHVWAGNVPALPIWSLISGLLVKSGCIGKVSSSEPLFAGLFVQALVEIEPRLADCLAVIWWKGGEEKSEHSLFSQADVVIGYGSNGSLRALKDKIPLTTRFLPFGHKISFGIVSNAALDAITREELQDDLLKLCRLQKTTVLFITHDITEAVYLCNKIAIVEDGRITNEFEVELPAVRDVKMRYNSYFNDLCLRIRQSISGGFYEKS